MGCLKHYDARLLSQWRHGYAKVQGGFCGYLRAGAVLGLACGTRIFAEEDTHAACISVVHRGRDAAVGGGR